MDSESSEHVVHDAVGPAFTPREAAATIGVGMNSLLVLGVLPVLLGALADEHRLTASGIGVTAMIEALTMGLATAAMGLVKRPRRLRFIAVATSLGLAGLDIAGTGLGGGALMATRAAAGAAEGVLLWITVSMIARTVTPERWAGVFFTAQTLAQLLLAIAFALAVLPRFGADGGLAALAAASLVGIGPALFIPRRFAPLVTGADQGGAPPRRGWIALLATLILVSAGGAVGVYLEPLAHQAGLAAGVARTALWTSLVAQVAGGAAATALAGRVRYFTVFVACSAAYMAAWALMGMRLPAWGFVSANVLAGFVGLFLGPFLVPMTIDADPSRRTAMQSGAAQLLGGALGPLLASQVVGDRDVHGVLWLGGALLLAGLAGVAWLRFSAAPTATRPQEA